MSTKHTVTLADGSTATRTSANRVYPYAVAVGPAPKAEVLARLNAGVTEHEGYLANYNEVIDYVVAGGELTYNITSYGSVTVYARGLAPRGSRSGLESQLGQRRVGTGVDDTHEVILERYRHYAAEAVKTIESHKAELLKVAKGPELVGKWRVSGWSSRPELAGKERDRLAGRYPGREVVVVETTYVTK